MPGPTTSSLDQRFSSPGAQPQSWEETRRRLAAAELFWISTVRADGRPHTTPLVAVWSDDESGLAFSTGAEEQKAVNLSHRAAVTLTTGDAGWESGCDIVLEGEAERVTDHARLDGLAAIWRTKWDGRWQYGTRDGQFQHPDGDGSALVFIVRPRRVLVFGKGDFSHTSHRFS